MNTKLLKALKDVQFRTPLRKHLFYRYEYFFHPAELAFLCNSLEETAEVPGDIVEIGCAQGASTVFLNKHRQWLESQDRFSTEKIYTCIDTFAGFTSEDIEYEENERGKKGETYDQFRINDIRWFDTMLEFNRIDRIKTIEADAGKFDYPTLKHLSFGLLDVDLYTPIREALKGCYPLLSEGGILIVDDCKPEQKWDGAYQAYQEFREEIGADEEIHFDKFGLIRK